MLNFIFSVAFKFQKIVIHVYFQSEKTKVIEVKYLVLIWTSNMVPNSGGSRISKAGVANHRDGGANLLFDNVFFSEKCMKMK